MMTPKNRRMSRAEMTELVARNTFQPYNVHPAAALFPLLNDEDLQDLADDIVEHSLQEPIVLTPDGTTIVDGRNRFQACRLAGVEPTHKPIPQPRRSPFPEELQHQRVRIR